ncbi:MAG: zinc ABC transporter substrate-binding protein [Xenococcus sp. MO_188.B8]|nr:zinc ABC transporter substrate-binding protein [Xenococcus sp. MO_188.B8]
MVNWINVVIVTISLALLPITGCSQRPTQKSTAKKLQIVVSILPQKYFVERVGGEYVSVEVMVEPGASPATYEPKPQQLRVLSQADAYVSIGVPFENAWMNRITAANPEMLIVDTKQGIERIPMAAHLHNENQEKSHTDNAENPDPHIWLSPQLVKVQAQTIYKALVQLTPERVGIYQANLKNFLADIEALDAELRESLTGLKQRKFMVFHPAWGYFARDYGLEMVPIELGGTEPSAAELAVLIAEARKEKIQVIFAQPEFSTRDAETIAQEMGGQVLLLDPLAADWLENLRSVSQTLAQVLSQSQILPWRSPYMDNPQPISTFAAIASTREITALKP